MNKPENPQQMDLNNLRPARFDERLETYFEQVANNVPQKERIILTAEEQQIVENTFALQKAQTQLRLDENKTQISLKDLKLPRYTPEEPKTL